MIKQTTENGDMLNCIQNNKLHILVKANASLTEILDVNLETKIIRVAIAAPADKNKANLEVIRFFSKLLKKKVRIASGLKSKEKVLEIAK